MDGADGNVVGAAIMDVVAGAGIEYVEA